MKKIITGIVVMSMLIISTTNSAMANRTGDNIFSFALGAVIASQIIKNKNHQNSYSTDERQYPTYQNCYKRVWVKPADRYVPERKLWNKNGYWMVYPAHYESFNGFWRKESYRCQ